MMELILQKPKIYRIFLYFLLIFLCTCSKSNNINSVKKNTDSMAIRKNTNPHNKDNEKRSILSQLLDTLEFTDVHNLKKEFFTTDSVLINKKSYILHTCNTQYGDSIIVCINFFNNVFFKKNTEYEKYLNRLGKDNLNFSIFFNNIIHEDAVYKNYFIQYILLGIFSFSFNNEKYIYLQLMPNGVVGRPIISTIFFKVSNKKIIKIKEFNSELLLSIKDYNNDKKIDILYNKEQSIDTNCCKKYTNISQKIGLLSLDNDTFIEYKSEKYFIDYCYYSKDTVKICNISGFKVK